MWGGRIRFQLFIESPPRNEARYAQPPIFPGKQWQWQLVPGKAIGNSCRTSYVVDNVAMRNVLVVSQRSLRGEDIRGT